MEIVGKIIEALPEASGTSQAGRAWKKREYVLETLDVYPRKIFFSFFGERADLFPLQPGQVIKLTFDIDSRNYNGRWYPTINGLKAEDPNAGVQTGAAAQAPQQQYTQTAPQQQYGQAANDPFATSAPQQSSYGQTMAPPPVTPAEPTDDLPF